MANRVESKARVQEDSTTSGDGSIDSTGDPWPGCADWTAQKWSKLGSPETV